MNPLVGERVRLRPLSPTDGPALVQAAADGELWHSVVSVVPAAVASTQRLT